MHTESYRRADGTDADAPSIRQWPFLFVTIIILVGLPVASAVLGPTGTPIIMLMLFVAGAFSVVGSRRSIWFCACAGGLAVALQSLVVSGHAHGALAIAGYHLLSIFVVAYVSWQVLRAVVHTSDVTSDTVVGGVTAYLLLGVLFAFLYSLLESFSPGSFHVPATMEQAGESMTLLPVPGGDSGASAGGASPLLYFSFTTLSTLGYGDISPATPLARSLSTIQTISGQLYLAILISRLVGVARFVRIAGGDRNT